MNSLQNKFISMACRSIDYPTSGRHIKSSRGKERKRKRSFESGGDPCGDQTKRGRADFKLTSNSSAARTRPMHTRMTSNPKHRRESFEEKYVEQARLGEGGYGSVFAGYRRCDNLPVAVKHVPISDVVRTPVTTAGELRQFPLEVLLLVMVGQGSQASIGGGEGGSQAAVALLDWYELDQELLIVLERPVPAVDLFDYIHDRGGFLSEDTTKVILRQLVEALISFHARGVVHRDIKTENILVETGSDFPKIRVLDFGCGAFLKDESYKKILGTTEYIPPEWYCHRSYEAVPATVWQLGVLLYVMLSGEFPFNTPQEVICHSPSMNNLSRQCQDLLRSCLEKCTNERPTLEGILRHPWLE